MQDDSQFPLRQRRHIRFGPEPAEFALLAHKDVYEEPFEPDAVALISNMAPMGGCCLLIRADYPVRVGDRCVIRLGELRPLVAVLRWRRPLDEEYERFGFQFIE